MGWAYYGQDPRLRPVASDQSWRGRICQSRSSTPTAGRGRGPGSVASSVIKGASRLWQDEAPVPLSSSGANRNTRAAMRISRPGADRIVHLGCFGPKPRPRQTPSPLSAPRKAPVGSARPARKVWPPSPQEASPSPIPRSRSCLRVASVGSKAFTDRTERDEPAQRRGPPASLGVPTDGYEIDQDRCFDHPTDHP